MKKSQILAFANLFVFFITIAVNYLSNSGFINGNTMKTISDKYHNLFTPAPYAFSIWGIIYLLLFCFLIYSFSILNNAEHEIINKIGVWFIVSCVANCCWVFAWLNEYLGLSVVLMIVLFISLLKIILNTKAEVADPPFKVIAFVWWPFVIYIGWICVALIADIAALLTQIQWDGFGLSENLWTKIVIAIAGIIYLLLTWVRNMRESGFVGIWALIAVAVSNKETDNSIYLTAIAVAVIIGISSLIHGWKNFKGYGNEKIY
ncbi:MAG: tryptophan-rich sensory protein [Bacteroidetes bacterium]|nr:tryptophan-rich sensory protein [Bacteroidota bacterium]